MFLFFFLFSFALSFFFFFFFSFYYKKLHKQQQEAKSQNEPAILNRPLSDIVDKNAQSRENDPTHLPHSLLLEILPSDSAKWAGLFSAENHPSGDSGQVGSGREGELGVDDQRTKKKKKRGKKKRLDSKGEEENGEEKCSFAEEDKKEPGQVGGPGSRVKSELVCLYPFTSTSSATQRKIKQQYDLLVKCNENKGLTLAQVGGFANCLIDARNELQHKSEVIKRKFTITKALLFKADRSSFDRLRQQIYKLEMEQKRLEEDAFVYNWLQQQLKLSPAYKKMLEIVACMELKGKSGELMEGADTEFADISFEELLAQEKKDSFWQKNGKSRLSSN
ncbi:hypothetical protein REPUB_Repub13aG0187000 [Reevesia pubescens]